VIEIVFHDPGGQLLPLVLDAAPSERHQAASMATEHEVERGVSPSDHVRPERRLLTLEVVISDTPIRATAALGGSVQPVELSSLLQSSTGWLARIEAARRDGSTWQAAVSEERAPPAVRMSIFTPDREPTRIADSWALLELARDKALLATVTTKFKTYENMALIELVADRSAKDGSWLSADLTFAEIRMVSTELVDDPLPARPRDRRTEDRGSVETEEAPPQRQSLLSRALDALGGS
jgi:hypothetical protein